MGSVFSKNEGPGIGTIHTRFSRSWKDFGEPFPDVGTIVQSVARVTDLQLVLFDLLIEGRAVDFQDFRGLVFVAVHRFEHGFDQLLLALREAHGR